MSLINQFNGLGGTTTSRENLNQIRIQAVQEGNTEIASRIANLLLAYPEASQFELENDDYIIEPVPASFLHGLDYEQAPDEPQGLGRVSPTEVYDMITAKIITMIEAANARDYKKTWEAKEYGSGYTIPFNFASKKRYRGVNVLMLTELEPLENPFFLTFKQVKDLKGKVKKGAKGFEVVYFTKIWKTEDKPKNLKFSSYDKTKVESFATENGIQNDLGVIPMLKYYHVYNGKDIEGIDFGLEKFKLGFIDLEKPADEVNRMPIPEAILKNYPKPQPTLKFGGNRAFYSPGKDLIQMPYLSDFETVQDYYRTLLHEYSHSTGASKRLSRDFSGSQGSKKYAFEELVAELGAIFLSAEAGIVWHNNKNHAAYLKGWNSVLTQIKDDNKFIMKASTAAQKIADYVLQFDANGDPLYFEDLKNVKPEKKTIPKLDEDQQKRMLEKFKKAAGKDKEIKTVKKGEELHYMQNNIKIASINKLGVITWHKKGITTALRNKIRKDAATIGTTSGDEKKTKEPVEKQVVKTKDSKKSVPKKIAITNTSKIIFDHFEKLAQESKNADEFRSKVYVFKNGDNTIVDDLRTIYGGKMRSFAEACFSFYDKFHKPITPIKKEVIKKTVTKKRTPKPKNTFEVAAISDVLKLEKFQELKPYQGKLLFEKFKNDIEASVELNAFEAKSFKETSFFYSHSYDGSYGETIILESLGKEFIASVLGRLDSLQNQKTSYALFEGLKVPVDNNIESVIAEITEKETVPGETKSEVEEKVNLPLNRNSLAYRRQNRSNAVHEYYKIENPNVLEFLGQIEKKKKESVAITIAGGQGSGKTSFVFQLINEFAKHYKVGHASIEEHPESALYENKAERFWNENAKANVDSPEINSMEDIHDLIMRNDVIVIDSFSKLLSMNNKITLDETFRKKYDGKLFVIIYQLTTDGKMRGGSSSQFDGDIILFVEKFPDFSDNYVFADKNRYQNRSLDELHYNIATAKLMIDEPEEKLVFTEEVERI